jgi:CheY-like chemotaxis protein
MILFIDDEQRYISPFVEELKLRLGPERQVRLVTDVGEALSIIGNEIRTIELVVLDIMMPPGKHFDLDEAGGGLRTGTLVYGKIREQAPTLPVIILTNVADPSLAVRFRGENKCWYLRKADFFPHEFGEACSQILSEGKYA